MKWKVALAVLVSWVLLFACKKDKVEPMPSDPPPTSPVVFDPANVPYDSLSSYAFFEGSMADQLPAYGVLPFEPITPLFTDYAHKHRFVWMPDSVQAEYNGDGNIFSFPDNTVLIKTFYYDHVQPADETKIIETRIMFKLNGVWQFANYIWNEDQTEAILDLNGANVPLEWTDDNGTDRSTIYRIPSEAECFTCHKITDMAAPIGPKPQNLNKDLFYTDGAMGQIQKWQEMGYLGSMPTNINTVPDWTDESIGTHDRVRAYLDMNCAHCHADERHCDYRPIRLSWQESVDTTDLGVCVVPDEIPLPQYTHIVSRGVIARSVMHFRMNTNDETLRMPLLGRTVIHDEAIELIEEWIEAMEPPCN